MLVKLVLLTILWLIFIQDYKNRQVNALLFPALSVLGAWLYWSNTITQVFLLNIAFNLVFITILLLTVVIYAKYELKQPLNQVFGLGDALFFLALSLMFATVTFVVLMISALLFSLVIHLVLKNKQTHQSVPLAGYMSLFVLGFFVLTWLELYNYHYSF